MPVFLARQRVAPVPAVRRVQFDQIAAKHQQLTWPLVDELVLAFPSRWDHVHIDAVCLNFASRDEEPIRMQQ